MLAGVYWAGPVSVWTPHKCNKHKTSSLLYFPCTRTVDNPLLSYWQTLGQIRVTGIITVWLFC